MRRTMALVEVKKVKADRESGVGMWVQEVGELVFFSHPYNSILDRLAL